MCASSSKAKKKWEGRELPSYVASKPADLKADFALVSDTELFAPGLPTLCVGLRGMIYTELEVRGAKTDLHSGMYGGAAPNPFVSLAQIIAKLKDENGHILIPGFYDDIIPPSPEELAAWRSLPFDEEEYRKTEVGSKQLVGEAGYSVLERTWARPTLDVHGMPGGFIGAGAKTVIPAKAIAKVSMRLVPGMTPAKAFALYKSYVEKIAPAGVDVDVRLIHSGDACLIPVNNRYIQAATRALHEVWGKDTVFIRSGGSIPIVGDFDRHLGLPSVMMGFGLPDDNLHAPNEKFNLKNFELGIRSRSSASWRRLAVESVPDARTRDLRAYAESCDAAGFVLAGGQSSRMGHDKALLAFAGRPLIDHALATLHEAGLSASIAGANPSVLASLAAFAPVVEDLEPGRGPLAGICAALASTSARYAVFLPVDLPLLPSSLIVYLFHHARITGHAVTVPSVNGFAETFPAVLRPFHPARSRKRTSVRPFRLLCRIPGCGGRPRPIHQHRRR